MPRRSTASRKNERCTSRDAEDSRDRGHHRDPGLPAGHLEDDHRGRDQRPENRRPRQQAGRLWLPEYSGATAVAMMPRPARSARATRTGEERRRPRANVIATAKALTSAKMPQITSPRCARGRLVAGLPMMKWGNDRPRHGRPASGRSRRGRPVGATRLPMMRRREDRGHHRRRDPSCQPQQREGREGRGCRWCARAGRVGPP